MDVISMTMFMLITDGVNSVFKSDAAFSLFKVWQNCKRDNQFENYHQELRWCAKNLVNYKGLREWNMLVTEIKQRLDYLGIVDIPRQTELNEDIKPLIMKVTVSLPVFELKMIRLFLFVVRG